MSALRSLARAVRRLLKAAALRSESSRAGAVADALLRHEALERRRPLSAELPAALRDAGFAVEVFGRRSAVSGGAQWHRDPDSGREWPRSYHKLIRTGEVVNGSDVKVPWELSRLQFLPPAAVIARTGGDAATAQWCVDVLLDWIAENGVGFGVNWTCSMEVALRAISILFVRRVLRESSAWTTGVDDLVVASVSAHRDYIAENLEDWGEHSQNHLVSDLVGLVVIGLELDGAAQDAAEWFARLELCMESQVYPDGVSFENSVAYHMLVAELFGTALTAARRAGVAFSAGYEERLRKMFGFVAAIAAHDGRVPLIGDADDGRVLMPAGYTGRLPDRCGWLLALGQTLWPDGALGPFSETDAEAAAWAVSWAPGPAVAPVERSGAAHLAEYREGGVYALRSGGELLVANAARTGVAGTGPHRHDDPLSFTLDVAGQPFLVDAGTYCYQHDPAARRRFRSAVAHNTLQVDGVEPNDLSQLFALSSDGIGTVESHVESDGARTRVVATCDAYRSRGVSWRRSYELDGVARIEDTLQASGRHYVTLALHLHPDVSVLSMQREDGVVILHTDSARVEVHVSGGVCSLEAATQASQVSARYRDARATTALTLTAAFDDAVLIRTTVEPVHQKGGAS